MARKALEDVLARDSADVANMFENTKKNSAAAEKNDEGAEQAPVVRMIPWADIKANAANFYSTDDVEELVNSIKMHGLLDPVVVSRQDDGTYLLISGHRRHKAWGILREEDPGRYGRIPAIVRLFSSGPMTELALIMANSSARRMSSPEIAKQAQRVEELLYELKEQGYSFPGRMRDQVAKACDVSATKLARLKVIRDRLSESWTPIWEGGQLPEATAYELAQGPAEFQERIFKVTGGKAPNCHNVTHIRNLMAQGVTYDGTQVKKPGCDKCTHGDAFLRHDLGHASWENCTGTSCCLKCDYNTGYQSCERACSKAKKVRSEANAKAKEEQAAKEKEAARRLREEIRKSAERLLKAAEAAGLDDSTVLPTSRWDKKPVSWLRAAADPDGDIGYVYRNPLTAEDLDAPAVAKLLQCSTDYLYGLTDELRPQAGAYEWAEPREYDPPIVEAEQVISEVVSESDTYRPGDMQFRPGKPKERTLAWCAFTIDGTEMTSIAVYWPHLDAWCFEHGARIDAECVGWYPVPDWRGVLRDEPKEG